MGPDSVQPRVCSRLAPHRHGRGSSCTWVQHGEGEWDRACLHACWRGLVLLRGVQFDRALSCPSTLYSTRVMCDLFSFTHNFEACSIKIPWQGHVEIRDDSMSFKIKRGFVPHGAPRPSRVQSPSRLVPVIALATGSVGYFPEGVPETLPVDAAGATIARLYQRLGFPYADQWRLVPFSTTHHGLSIDKPVPTNLSVSQAVIRGRS